MKTSTELKAEILEMGRAQIARYNEGAEIGNEIRRLLMRLDKLAVAQESDFDIITNIEAKFIGAYNEEFPREPIPDSSFADILRDDTSIPTDSFEDTLPIYTPKQTENVIAAAWKEFMR